MRHRLYDARILVAAGFLLACGLAAPAGTRAQETEDPAISGMSRDLRMGIRLYERGDDIQAMDRFMDVIQRGDPSERQMANEYINLITHRMNTGEKGPAPARPSERPAETSVEAVDDAPRRAPAAAAPREPVVAAAAPSASTNRAQEVAIEAIDTPRTASVRPTVERPLPPAPAPSASTRRALDADASMSGSNKALMKKEIRAKLRASLEQGLAELKGIEGIRLLMMSNGEPQALAIPSPLLFQQGIAFHKDAAKILDALTKVVFSLGGAQIVILPEGTSIGDAKVLDMRRTMGISAHLFSAGVAPARVRVNLLNTQVDIPKPLLDFRGITIVFVYNQPLGLVVESSIGEEAGPPVSMGIYPGTIRPDKGEGAVVEFSVQDPPAGLVSWKFQLLEPSEGGPTDLAPLQEVVGGSPVFHQIYWNGRRNYFGAPLAPGRYEAVLTATDGKNRQRVLHRWIQVLDATGSAFAKKPETATVTPAQAAKPVTVEKVAATETVPAAAVAAAGVQVGAPSADLGAAASGPLIKEVKGKKRAAPKRTAKGKKAAPAPKAAAEPAAEDAPAEEEAAEEAPKPAKAAGSKPATRDFELAFNQNTHQLTPSAEKTLAQVVDSVASFPLETLRIQGFAQAKETNAAQLADRRAKMVASLLINKYQIDPKKIQVGSSVTDAAAYRVQISFVKE